MAFLELFNEVSLEKKTSLGFMEKVMWASVQKLRTEVKFASCV